MMSLSPITTKAPFEIESGRYGYSKETIRLLASNWRWWSTFCTSVGASPEAPFDRDIIKAAVAHRARDRRSRATIDALLNTLSTASKAAGHPCPIHSQEFRDWLRTFRRTHLPARQRQAKGMTYPVLQKILSALDMRSAADARDGALLSAAFDGLLRSNEIASLQWEDVSASASGASVVLLRKSKTDQDGKGRQIFLSAETTQWLDAWGSFTRRQGAIFTALRGERPLSGLDTRSIRRIFKSRGAEAGFSGLSGHSARVGAAQDATAANVSLQSLMVAGRWSSPKMPARYGEDAHVVLLGNERLLAIKKLHAHAQGEVADLEKEPPTSPMMRPPDIRKDC